jgi:hypothetical protein
VSGATPALVVHLASGRLGPESLAPLLDLLGSDQVRVLYLGLVRAGPGAPVEVELDAVLDASDPVVAELARALAEHGAEVVPADGGESLERLGRGHGRHAVPAQALPPPVPAPVRDRRG